MKLRIIWLIFKQQWINITLDLFVHIGTSVTIYCFVLGTTFYLKKWQHILVVLFILFILTIFLYRAITLFSKWKHIDFPKKLFFTYVSSEVNSANNKIVSIAGDLSWLKHQKNTYKNLRSKNINIEIYYSKDDIKENNETKALIKDYSSLGIKMIPYPFEIHTKNIKGILIDSDENAKFLSFYKKNDDIINCTKYLSTSNEYHLAHSFIKSINSHIELNNEYNEYKTTPPKNSILIGVSGLNNIGKTTLCYELRLKYEESLITIGDTFIGDVKISNFEVALFCLLNQILEYNKILNEKKGEKNIFLFDRTPFDNFAFLLLHKKEEHNQYDRYIERLEQELKNFMAMFNIVVLLTPANKKYRYKRTTNLSIQQREKIDERVKKLYNNLYGKKFKEYKISKYKKNEDFKKRIAEIVNDLAQMIIDET